MTYWPDGMKVDPIATWPGTLTRNRTPSPFSADLTATLDLLQRELRALGARDVRLQIAVPASQFRLDGYPRATAKPDHPGIILTLQSKHGPLSYPCDTFTRWQDNLRAIALALEALRKVDRYGVTKRGEQYRGFLALEATSAPAGFATVDQAWEWLLKLNGGDVTVRDRESARAVLRAAQRRAHPDHGGDAVTFQRVSLAEALFRREGLL